MSFLERLQKSRLDRLDQLSDVDSFSSKYFSGTTLSLWKGARQLTSAVSNGLVLDAGGGRGAWRNVIQANAERESVDIDPKGDELPTWVADLTDMPDVPSGRYDAVVFHQVLEHIHTPSKAISELHRVLKPGGRLLVSVPHLSRQHELPHDYTRYTPQGLRRLLEEGEFEIEVIKTYCGLCSFVHHQLATVVIGVCGVFRPLALVAEYLNAPVSWLCWKIDAATDRRGLLAVGIIAVAKRK